MTLKEAILEWVIQVMGDEQENPKEHPWYKAAESYLETMGYATDESDLRYIWGMALDGWYDEFGTGDVGMDWDCFEETWKEIEKKGNGLNILDLKCNLNNLRQLRDYLNCMSEEVLEQPIIFGLTNDTLQDSWEVEAIRPLVNADMEFNEIDFLKEGRLIMQPYKID